MKHIDGWPFDQYGWPNWEHPKRFGPQDVIPTRQFWLTAIHDDGECDLHAPLQEIASNC